RNQLGGLRQITGIVYIVNSLTFSGIGAPGGTTPGGACTGFCNLISGNGDGSDISVSSGGVGTVGVFSNFIGTNQNGSQALPNVGRAVVVEGSNTTYVGLGFPGAPPLGNLISGNDGVGVAVTSEYAGRYSRAYIEGNLIGTDTTGSFAISNSQNQSPYFQGGIYVFSNFSDQIFVGDTSPEARNIVSGNTFDNGISVYDLGGKTKVVNNLIGLNRSLAPLGNGGNGIFLQGFGTQIGGATAEEGNQIAYNGTGGNNFAGVLVSNGYFGNTIRNNSIHDNSGLGIDLTGGYNRGDGVTANDCLDADAGANDLQNFPVLFAPVQSGENVTVPSVLRSSPSQPFAIDFYSNQNADPSGYGEGATYIGTKVVTTDSNGFAQFNFTSSASVSANSAITATATDGYGSTSEFSCAAGQCTNGFSSPEEYMQSPLEDSCIAPIVVNVNTDDADANTADGVCDTDVNTPDLQCSLRAAIQEANARAGFSLINFNIPGGGVQTITITSALPQINKQIFILGDTQPGYSDTPLIKIDGSQTSNAFGLAIAGGNSTVRALTVVGFQQGIGLSGLGRGIGGNKVQACYVGINSDGVTAPPQRQQIGIEIRNVSPNNRIGGILPSDRNVVSNNVVGIEIDSGSTGNLIYGNYVGTDKTGTQAVPNDFGIVADTANNNQIGSGDIENGGNLISGNTVDGISLTQNSQGTRVVGNLIGTDANGTTPVPNKTGVEIASGASQNFIGGTTSSQRNIISGQYVDNNSAGIVIRPDAGNGNHITGNYIGVTKYQDQTLTNYTGIGINADNQIVGSADTNDFPNVIGGSTFAGVYVHALADSANLSVENTQILNNLIGTSDNASPLGNYEGIELLDNVSNTQIVGNTVGYNSFAGIRLFTDSHDNSVLNNKVGIFANDSPIPNDNGIVVKQSNNNTVNGNVVSGNTSYGIALGDGVGSNSAAASFDSPKDAKPSKPADNQLTENNSITANKVGTSDDGANVVANGEGGIVVSANAQNNTIGGSRGAGEGNIVGGHTNDLAVGIFVGLLDDSQPEEIYPQNNRVEGNSVGFGAGNEPASLPNGTGIYLRNAKANFIGGDSADKGNVVGNSNESGIRLFLATTTENIVRNNFVGVLPDGQIAANQGDGISIDAAPLTTVQENTVGGNAGNGISIANLNLDSLKNKPSAPAFGGILKAVGNLVGNMKISGITTTIPNQLAGILVKDTKNILIGIESQDESSLKNIFSGNVGAGILIQGDSSDNTINNSIIGTDETGAANLGNGGDGICLMNVSGITIGSRDIANVANAANVIAGNQGSGVMIQGGGGHGIFGNIIGSVRNITTGIDTKLPNQFGLKILDSVGNIVGDVLAPLGNTISGNTDSGILLQNSLYNLIKHNDIGTDDAGATDLGNGADGVLITDNSRLNTVGGTDDGAGNTIAYNGSAGVRIDETAGHCNVVDPNLIFGNVGLGVDIGTPGHTPNDPDDADSGANNLQNYPEIVSHEIINGELVVSYKVDSAPEYSNYGADGSQGLYVEFFKADASGNQGEKFLGSDSYTLSDYNGSLIGTKTINLGDINTLGITANDLITATATDADGNTSEFFPAMQPTAAPVSVGGRVLTATGRGIGNARVSLTNANGETRMAMTNAFGFYHFADVESGATYILSVAAKRYRFENPTRVLSVNEEIENADFVALP
ncbi:MAG: carboxypeptidase regulatory-like domain-containing protein, partial [Pyrinomonadaceae bacterium]